ncbi:MAG TPA: cytochrome c [Candidatus Dormibacteraeota bacterium]|nr:cytochrome c [Candidatus Dormibacteraeota bacterium]
MGRFILGVVVGFLLIAGGAYIYLTSGAAPVAATAQPMPFETYFAKKALHLRLQESAPKVVPIQATTPNLLEGAKVYKQDCEFCHGLGSNDLSPVGPIMFPHATQLFNRPPNFNPATMHFGVTDNTPGESYWKIKNGIRLSGMPPFEKLLTDQQMWDVALLVADAAKLPPEVNTALAPTPAPAAPAAGPATPASSKAAKKK